MKYSIILLWLKLFNHKNLFRITASDIMPYGAGELFIMGENVSGYVYARYIKDEWCVRTDGRLPWYLVAIQKMSYFFSHYFRYKPTVVYIGFIKFLCKKFPKWGDGRSDTPLAKIIFLPVAGIK